MAGMELPRSDETVRAATRFALAATASLVLVASGLLLFAVADFARLPDSDTGETASTASVVAAYAVGALVLLLCLPVMYLCVRSRPAAAALLTIVGVVAAIVTLQAF